MKRMFQELPLLCTADDSEEWQVVGVADEQFVSNCVCDAVAQNSMSLTHGQWPLYFPVNKVIENPGTTSSSMRENNRSR
jgi:hypothetical protein